MAKHSLYPGFVKIHYTSNAHPHVQVLPIGDDPTPSGDSFTIPTRGSGAVDWQTAVTDFVTLEAALMDDASNFSSAEIYNFEAFPGPADFLQGFSLNIDGTAAGAAVAYAQMVMPFKGTASSAVRPSLMESVEPTDTRYSYADAGVPERAILDYILGDDDWIVTRGGSFPTVSLGFVTKINDKLRKRYFNP